jgi:hypothetical protein
METQEMMSQPICIMVWSDGRASISLSFPRHVHSLMWLLHDLIVLLRG